MNTFPRQCSAAAEAQPPLAIKNKNGKTLKIWEPAFLMKVMSSTTICSPPPSQNNSLLKIERLLSAIENTLKQAEGKLVFVFKCVQNVQKDSNLAETPVSPNQEKPLSGQSSPLYTDSSQLVPT